VPGVCLEPHAEQLPGSQTLALTYSRARQR
jgi:hypothetical protein